MSEFVFRQLTFGWPEKTTAGTYLWIWNADRIPPHIGISRGQNYFSLTYKACEIQKSVSTMIRKAKRLMIPLVLVDISDWDFRYDFTAVFNRYEKAIKGGPTCLFPVREVLGIEEDIRQLSGLLSEIQAAGKIKQVFALHLDDSYRGIPAYSVADIMERIEQLHDTHR